VEVRSLADVESFVTADGSTIRELFGLPTGGVERASLAEATLAPGQATQRHYHRESEEIYFVLDGEGEMEVDGERRRARGTSCERRATGRCGSSAPARLRTGTRTRSSSSRVLASRLGANRHTTGTSSAGDGPVPAIR
jgi:hypothetical protein